MAYELPPLPYPKEALEPHFDAQTMEIHHGKHHAAYVTNLNKAIAGKPDLESKSPEDLIRNLEALPADIRNVVRNNGGGHVNHSMFWKTIGPKAGGTPAGRLGDDIKAALSPPPSSAQEVASTFAEIGTIVQKGVNQAQSTVDTLQNTKSNGELKSAWINGEALEFAYESTARAFAVLSKAPKSLTIDGVTVQPKIWVFDDGWMKRLGISRRDFGIGMTSPEVTELTRQLDLAALREYRDAVGRRTREIVGGFKDHDWQGHVTADSLQRAADQGGFGVRSEGLIKALTGRPRAAVLSTIALFHPMSHMGEAATVRTAGGFGTGI